MRASALAAALERLQRAETLRPVLHGDLRHRVHGRPLNLRVWRQRPIQRLTHVHRRLMRAGALATALERLQRHAFLRRRSSGVYREL